MTTGATPPTAPKRSRARSFLPLAIVAWLVLEIWLLTLVARRRGRPHRAGLLLIAGGRARGRRHQAGGSPGLPQSLRDAPAPTGRACAVGPPSDPGKSDGNGLLMLGGLLIMIPGLISDVLGLLLLVPPVRSVARPVRPSGRWSAGCGPRRPGTFGDAFQQARIAPARRQGRARARSSGGRPATGPTRGPGDGEPGPRPLTSDAR